MNKEHPDPIRVIMTLERLLLPIPQFFLLKKVNISISTHSGKI